jgi:MFS family permease
LTYGTTPLKTSPFKIRNIRLFIAFRVFFNCRFYYPVFTILFLDYGLTLEQFALLNAAWAATIVMLEVPSGALADTVGRKNLLVFTGILMVYRNSDGCRNDVAVFCTPGQRSAVVSHISGQSDTQRSGRGIGFRCG